MSSRLAGKAIFVAGGGGIGNELARRYASEGAAVAIGDISQELAQQVAGEITAAGGTATGLHLNGADEASVRQAIQATVNEFGSLDGLHVNFACFKDGASGADILDLPLEVYDEVMEVNARGYVLCTREALPHMLRSGGGSIVYTSGGAAYKGEPVRLAYAMSKSAVHALARHVASRFGPEGVRANAISCGVIAHSRFYEVLKPEVIDALKSQSALKTRLGAPGDIAAMGALLMSEEGAYITGQVISVDGGITMRP